VILNDWHTTCMFKCVESEKMVRLPHRLNPKKTGSKAAVLERSLAKLIVGQQEAIHEIVNIYQMHLTGLNPAGRPVGNFLFLGPTGTGKTRIVEATAESLVGNPRAVIKIDCGEFQHSHEIAKLIGSPPGYLGHRETHPLLSQEVLNQHQTEDVPISFVLFDEIEKASDSLWNLLLGILDKATLTLGDNRRVDFSQAMVFMTSNLGAAEMSSIMSPGLGFGVGPVTHSTSLDKKLTDKISRAGVGAARKKFTPEFVNRIDKIVVFKPLAEDDLRQVLGIELSFVQHRVFSGPNPDNYFIFHVGEDAQAYLLKEGTDLRYGARHLKRAIERSLVQPMSNLVATEQIRGGDVVSIGFDSKLGQITFVREDEGLELDEMVDIVDCETPTGPAMAVAARSQQRQRPAASGRPG
jgi:ATP-dependent Clp protease ATP-binding subunit ClpB